jgi:hypothetical protein
MTATAKELFLKTIEDHNKTTSYTYKFAFTEREEKVFTDMMESYHQSKSKEDAEKRYKEAMSSSFTNPSMTEREKLLIASGHEPKE